VEKCPEEVDNVRIPASVESAQLEENGLSLGLGDIGRTYNLQRNLLSSANVSALLDDSTGPLPKLS
jgi:hypothetical protein